jgi:hypothetical protein
MLGENLVAKNLRQKCMNKDLRKMIENIESLNIIQETMEVCYEKLEKYTAEALKPEAVFRKNKAGFLLADEGSHPRGLGHGAPEDAQQ